MRRLMIVMAWHVVRFALQRQLPAAVGLLGRQHYEFGGSVVERESLLNSK